MKALFLNCTLKPSGKTSNTEAFIDQAKSNFADLGVATESLRVADYKVAFGNTSDEGDGDQWPEILQKIYDTDILVMATPVWRGDRSAIAKMVAERMDGIMEEGNDKNGQYPTYNKVAVAMIDGNEDGAKRGIAAMLFDLNEQGFSIPVNAFSYYVGKAGPGKSYIKAKGDKHEFTNKTLLYMVHNAVDLAKKLKKQPIETNLNKLDKKAKEMSK